MLCPLNHILLGFHSLTQELNGYFAWKSSSESKERFLADLQQIFTGSVDEKEDEVKSLTEKYHKYKREYVKHISFNPEQENFSKCFLDIHIIFICFQLLCWSMHH